MVTAAAKVTVVSGYDCGQLAGKRSCSSLQEGLEPLVRVLHRHGSLVYPERHGIPSVEAASEPFKWSHLHVNPGIMLPVMYPEAPWATGLRDHQGVRLVGYDHFNVDVRTRSGLTKRVASGYQDDGAGQGGQQVPKRRLFMQPPLEIGLNKSMYGELGHGQHPPRTA